MDTIWRKDDDQLSSRSTASRLNSIRTSKTVRIYTIISDLLLINLGFFLAYLARYQWQLLKQVEPQYTHAFSEYFLQQLFLNVFLIVTFTNMGTWRRRRGEIWLDEVYRIGRSMTASFMAMFAFQFIFFRDTANSRLMLFWAALFIAGLISIARLIRRLMLQRAYRKGQAVDHVLIVGSGETGRGTIRSLLARPDLGFKAVGYLDDGSDRIGSRRIPHLGTWTELDQIILNNPNLHTIFIALPADRNQDILQITKQCIENGIEAQIVPDFFQLSLGRVEMNNMGGIPVIGVRDVYTSPLSMIFKRIMDLVIVALFAVPGLLIAAFIAIAIKLDDGGPLFYRAERFGKDGKPFGMYKFRSMVLNADDLRQELWAQNESEGAIFKIKNDPRLTKVGKITRKLSLDELPQFYNILIGDMSFVGPRPPIRDEVEQYDDWHYRRLDVKGGLTGLWQVSGRADLTFDEACLLDIYYIENWSLAMDTTIILQTVPYILFGQGGAY